MIRSHLASTRSFYMCRSPLRAATVAASGLCVWLGAGVAGANDAIRAADTDNNPAPAGCDVPSLEGCRCRG